MAKAPLGIPRSIAGQVAVAFFTFFGVLAGHAMLETARDTLFLTELPAERLPWVYLAIAGLAVAAARINHRAMERFSKRAALSLTLFVSGVLTAGFWLWTDGGEVSIYSFYIWTGLIATVAVVQVWLLVGEALDPNQAKRAFAIIGAGALIGATFGSAVASALLRFTGPRSLILVASALLVGSSALPALGWRRGPFGEQRQPRRAPAEPESTSALSHPYLRRLLILVTLTQLTVTAADLLFKAVVADTIEPENLGSFFALFYTGLNGLSLFVQLVLAGWLLRRLGVSRALWVLPVSLGAAALGFGVTGALVPMLFIKVFDGSMRHSLHKTGTELLYLPLSVRLRERHKVTIDAVGARAGQAAASLAILGALSFGLELPVVGFGLVALVALLLWSVAGIKHHYVDLFREQLRQGTIETRASVPALDLHSLEALIAGMSSTDDAVALAAIDLLAASGRANLVPPLILYHPSSEVVVRALAILSDNGRRDFLPIARRLVQSIDPEVRTAALRAIGAAANGEDQELLRQSLTDPAPTVRATALVSLMCRACDDDYSRDQLRALIEAPDPAGRLALVRAVRYRAGSAFYPLLRELAAVPEPELMAEVARSVAADPHESFVPVLVPMLADRGARPEARAALIAIGQPALIYLDRALSDVNQPRRVRLHLPRTISKFGNQAAVDVLSRHLDGELDTVVGYKILRGLGRMISDNHRLHLEPRRIDRWFEESLHRAITLLDWRVNLREQVARGRDGSAGESAAMHIAPASGELLLELLREKERASLERVFRLLGLRHPEEDFRAMYTGLRAGQGRMAASSRELLEFLVEPRARDAIFALIDRDADDDERLEQAAEFYRPEATSTADRLRAMLGDPSDALAGLAAHYVAHAGFGELGSELREAMAARRGRWMDVLDQAVHVLRRVREVPSAG
jgi:ATP:ADP antiporter, AAA family